MARRTASARPAPRQASVSAAETGGAPLAAPSSSLVRVALVFMGTFALLTTAHTVICWYIGGDPLVGPTTVSAGSLIRLVGIGATTAGNSILLASRTLRIDTACTSIGIVSMYTALVVAYPLRPRLRLLALAVGIPVILLANLLRLVAVAWASENLSAVAFGFAHDYLFQVGMVLVAVCLWAAWLAFARAQAR